MSSFIDILMVLLFFIFMVFIFGGYHKNKYAQREKELNSDYNNNKSNLKERKKKD